MANKPKIGLDYFPFEVGFFDDIKIRKLIKHQGCKAIPVYTLLLCNIYKEGYYLRWDNELPFILSEKTGYDEAFITEVIKCCLKVDLFSNQIHENHKVLTSAGIQMRYREICRILKRKAIVSEFKIIPSEELPDNSEELLQKKEKEIKEKERKGEERKQEEVSRSQILNLIYKDLWTDRNKYFPELVAKYDSAFVILCEKKLSAERQKIENDKIFMKHFKGPVMKEIESMWNWYHKTNAHEKVVSWISAMHSWLDKKGDFKR